MEWWNEPDLYAITQSAGSDPAIILLNRSDSDRTISNGLAFAGLPDGAYTDVASGETVVTAGDRITIDVPARSSRVLVVQ